MASDGSESDDDADFLEGSIKPCSFEPEYTRDEFQLRKENACSDQRQPETEEINWCCCTMCFDDKLIIEKVCCKSPKILSDDTFADECCVTKTGSFQSICLNKDVLQVALSEWNDLRGDNKEFENNNFRFIAYMQYILWCHGHMGRRNRTPLPNCVLRKIREVFPDDENKYVPYMDADAACQSFNV